MKTLQQLVTEQHITYRFLYIYCILTYIVTVYDMSFLNINIGLKLIVK